MRKLRTNTSRRVIGLLGAGALVTGLLIAGQPATVPAQAVDASLPTWDEVQEAKQNQASATAKTKEVEELIASGEKELDRLRNLHSTAVEEYNQAVAVADAASEKAQNLETQAEESQKAADEAAEQAGVIVAQMYRSGGVDRGMELFLETEADTADALLERLASMSKASERNTQISDEAEQAANTAASLGKQAEVAKKEFEKLRDEAQAKEQQMQQAVTDQGDKVKAQEAKQTELKAQLAALKDTTTKTVKGYEERLRQEEADRLAEEKRRQEEAAELARQQEQAAIDAANAGGGPAAAPDTTPSTGGGGGGSTPTPTTGGWVLPTSGYYISEGYRPPGRPDHTGIDLATACGTPIVAAMGGTVGSTYWDGGGGGNMVTVNHPNGWQTRYAHMISWAVVSPGQTVYAGQVIGYVGTTGASTGCHLHFETRPNQDQGWYGFVDPLTVMSL